MHISKRYFYFGKQMVYRGLKNSRKYPSYTTVPSPYNFVNVESCDIHVNFKVCHEKENYNYRYTTKIIQKTLGI